MIERERISEALIEVDNLISASTAVLTVVRSEKMTCSELDLNNVYIQAFGYLLSRRALEKIPEEKPLTKGTIDLALYNCREEYLAEGVLGINLDGEPFNCLTLVNDGIDFSRKLLQKKITGATNEDCKIALANAEQLRLKLEKNDINISLLRALSFCYWAERCLRVKSGSERTYLKALGKMVKFIDLFERAQDAGLLENKGVLASCLDDDLRELAEGQGAKKSLKQRLPLVVHCSGLHVLAKSYVEKFHNKITFREALLKIVMKDEWARGDEHGYIDLDFCSLPGFVEMLERLFEPEQPVEE